MSVAYSSKNLVFPIHALKSLLLYDKEQDLINDCKYYGLEVQDGICFLKSSFDDNRKMVRTFFHFAL